MLLDSMNPAAGARTPLWIDLDRIPVGDRMTISWHGVPIFLVHRTPEETSAARTDDTAEMPFPEPDANRVQRDDWLIVIGLDTFQAWNILTGQGPDDDRGNWGGWYERQHNSHYDSSGRLRHGPGTANLIVPDYRFVSDSRVEIAWPIEALPKRP